MAPRKKPSQRRGAQSPNTALVLFLVFFVLLSIGLGVWGYYGYQGQKDFEAKAEKANVAAKAAKKAEEWALFQAYEARLAIGENLIAEADLDEANARTVAFDDFVGAVEADKVTFKEGTKYKDFKDKGAIQKLIEGNVKSLGWDGKKYAKNYREVIAGLEKELEKLRGDVADATAKKDEAEKKAQDLVTKYDPFWEQVRAQIKEGNDKALQASTKRTAEMDDLQAQAVKMRKEMEDLRDANAKSLRAKDVIIRELEVRAQVGGAKPAADAPPEKTAAAPRPAGELHPLAMDVSTGKPLWDVPQGKIIRVEPQGRKVYIDRGSAQGIQPQMTFTVFPAGSWKDRAEGMMKGTIEVQNVIDANTSMARITSLYDVQGREVPLGDTSRGVYHREADNPLREGDLVFNLALGTHVAIAGNVSWDGYESDAPAEQMRHLQQFIGMLRRQGVTVDAYVDLTDGQIKGNLTPKTAYLIRGYVPEVSRGGDQEAKTKLNKGIADAMQALRGDAIDRGAFIISAENFLNVIGYRRPRSASEATVSDWRPSLPAAGSGLSNPQTNAVR